MNDFLKKVDIAASKPMEFWAKLVNSLDRHEVPSPELFDDLDDNFCDISDYLDTNIVYPGQIYYFDYQSKQAMKYKT